jgi:hypothetical protein
VYIKYNETNYPCDCNITLATIQYIGLPEDFPAPVSGDIVLCANDGFVIRTDKVEDYLRQTFEDGVLTLTNLPEPVEPDPIEPTGEPTTAEILDTLLGVTNDG